MVRSASVLDVAAMEKSAPGVEVPMPILALERYKGGFKPLPPPPVASVPQENTPVTLAFTSQLAALSAETVRLVVEAVPLTVRAALVVAPLLIPTLPFASIMKAVDVAEAVEVEMANRFWLSSVAVEVAAMERRGEGGGGGGGGGAGGGAQKHFFPPPLRIFH